MNQQEEKKFNQVSQFSHFFFGAFVILLSSRLAVRFSHPGILWLALALLVVYSAGKEIWDEYNQPPDIRGSGWMDFSVQVGGAVVALLLIHFLQ